MGQAGVGERRDIVDTKEHIAKTSLCAGRQRLIGRDVMGDGEELHCSPSSSSSSSCEPLFSLPSLAEPDPEPSLSLPSSSALSLVSSSTPPPVGVGGQSTRKVFQGAFKEVLRSLCRKQRFTFHVETLQLLGLGHHLFQHQRRAHFAQRRAARQLRTPNSRSRYQSASKSGKKAAKGRSTFLELESMRSSSSRTAPYAALNSIPRTMRRPPPLNVR